MATKMLTVCRFVFMFQLLLALASVVSGKPIPDHVTAIEYARGYESAIKPNAKLKDFEIIRFLGGGAFGKVSLVKYKPTQQHFAMKEIVTPLEKTEKHDVLTCDWEFIDKELKIMRGMDSPFIVKLHYYFFDNKPKQCIMYLVIQPFMPGDLLKMIITTGALMHNKEYAFRFIAANMVLGVEYMHKRKVAHRDIKLENFLVGDDGYVALSDFGLSVLIKENCTTNDHCGSPIYMAPEILTDKPYNHNVDWWSLGVTLYSIATGTMLFFGNGYDEVTHNVLNQPIVMPDTMSPNMKSFLLGLITRDPAKRLGAKSIEEVKNHPFFEGADWSGLEKKSIPAPIVPHFDANGKLEKYYDVYTWESFFISSPAITEQSQQHNSISTWGSVSLPSLSW